MFGGLSRPARRGLLIGWAVLATFALPLGVQSPWALFFPPALLHNGDRGVDFYEVPRGAYTLLRGGTISGDDQRTGWAPGRPSNPNGYPPVFTLALGVPLQMFSPAWAERIWLLAKVASLAALALYAARRFAGATHVGFALIVLCCSPVVFYDIQIL